MPIPCSSHIVVALNGTYDIATRLRPVVDSADVIIACDGGANWLHSQGYRPDYLMGDMDSISPQVLDAITATGTTIERYPSAKDKTDGELGLGKAVDLGADRITLLGALGGRIDHELANIMLLAMPCAQGRSVTIYDGRSYLFLTTQSETLAGMPGDTVSLIPWAGEVHGITTTGLEYPLLDEPLYVGPARGVSNVMLTDSATISVREGTLLVIHTPHEGAE